MSWARALKSLRSSRSRRRRRGFRVNSGRWLVTAPACHAGGYRSVRPYSLARIPLAKDWSLNTATLSGDRFVIWQCLQQQRYRRYHPAWFISPSNGSNLAPGWTIRSIDSLYIIMKSGVNDPTGGLPSQMFADRFARVSTHQRQRENKSD